MPFNKFTLTVIVLLSFWSCQNKKKTVVELLVEKEMVIDLADFTAQEIYSQHLIFEIPAELQTEIDSLSRWITSVQPGGLKLSDWTLGNIQTLTKAIDTLPIIPPFIIDSYWDRLQSKKYEYTKANPSLTDSKYTSFFHESGINIIDFDHKQDSLDASDTYYPIQYQFPTGELQNGLSKCC